METVTARQSSARILVADDSPGVLAAARQILGGAGYDVAIVDNGANVVDLAVTHRPTLILLDFAMPQVNGFDVLRILGEHPALGDIPVVIMSTRGDSIAERFVTTLGVTDHITKPFSAEALLAVVEHTLQRSQSPSTPSASTFGAVSSASLPESPSWSLASYLAHAAGGNKKLARSLDIALRASDAAPLLRECAIAQPPALMGDLAIVPITEVMQLLGLQRQTGFLTVRNGPNAIAVALQRGGVRLVTGEQMGREFLLGTILVQERLLRPEELDAILSDAARAHERLGERMLRRGALDRDDLVRALRRQSSELVYEMLRWRTGCFELQRRDSLPPELLEHDIGLTIDELLMEGFRRVDEWGLIETVLPTFEIVLTRAPGSNERARAQGLTEAELAVLAQIDGQRTVRDVVASVGSPTFEVARLLYRLVSAHLATPSTS